MKTISKLMILFLIIGFVQTGSVEAQSWKDIKNKTKNVKLKKKKKTPTKTSTTTTNSNSNTPNNSSTINSNSNTKNTTTTTNSNNNTQNNSSTSSEIKKEDKKKEVVVKKEEVVIEKVNPNLLPVVTAEQTKIIAENKIEIDGAYKDKTDFGGLGHLIFTNDFNNKDANIISFSNKDRIYAHFKIDKKIASSFPVIKKKVAGVDMEYTVEELNITLYLTVDDQESKKSVINIKNKDYFELVYDTKEITFAIVDDGSFYSSIIEKYKKDAKFETKVDAAYAYNDVISRIFLTKAPNTFKNLAQGNHKVGIKLEIEAVYSYYGEIVYKNINGVFMITIDEESKKCYTDNYNMLTALHKEYKQKASNTEYAARGDFAAEKEKRKLAKMTPEEKKAHDKKELDEYIKERNAVMDNYKENPSEAGDNEFTIYVKNNNSGVSVRIIEKSSRGNENIYTITPNQTQKLSLFKGQNYTILLYGQSAAKSTARKVASVSEKNDGQTINVK